MITLTRLIGPEESAMLDAKTFLLDTPVNVVLGHHLYTLRQVTVYSVNDVAVGLEDAQETEPWSGTDIWTTVRALAYGSNQEGMVAAVARELIDALWLCDELFTR